MNAVRRSSIEELKQTITEPGELNSMHHGMLVSEQTINKTGTSDVSWLLRSDVRWGGGGWMGWGEVRLKEERCDEMDLQTKTNGQTHTHRGDGDLTMSSANVFMCMFCWREGETGENPTQSARTGKSTPSGVCLQNCGHGDSCSRCVDTQTHEMTHIHQAWGLTLYQCVRLTRVPIVSLFNSIHNSIIGHF